MTDATTHRDDHLRRSAIWARKARETSDKEFARFCIRVAMYNWCMAKKFPHETEEK